MKNIIIVGAGKIGRYIASILSKEQHNVVLVDSSPKKLQLASSTMDIATRLGNGTDWKLLENLLELSPELLIALTDDDNTNLVACSIAKNLGYSRTICRIKDGSFLNKTRLDFGRLFNVDHFIGPEILIPDEILKYILAPGSLAVESFAHGAIQMRTIVVPHKWRQGDIPLRDLHLPPDMIIALIRRMKNSGDQVIFPHGNDCILPGDEVTLIGETDVIIDVHHFFGIPQKIISSAVIIGGSVTGFNLATLLVHNGISVRLIDNNQERCVELAAKLPTCSIINHSGTDFDFYRSEKIGQADILIACTESDDVNVVAGLLGKESGCEEVVVMQSNTTYASLISRMGIHHIVSPRVIAANHILSQILSGTVTSLVSLYENRAEVMEINVSMDSEIVGISLSELGPLLPKDFLIAMIQNRGRIMVANGNRIISPGDTVIVMTDPKHVDEIRDMF